MTFASDLLPMLNEVRAIAGGMGIRPYRFYVIDETYVGEHTGEGLANIDETEIVESGNRPPRWRFLSTEEIALGNLPGGAGELGPVTPGFTGGGTYIETLKGDLERGATRHGRLVGPGHPNGSRYRITAVIDDKAFHYMIRAVPVANGA